jgi:polysaccharide pyruvyl transferase CsaB
LKFVISGFYGLGNTGDEAILVAIIDNLRLTYPDPDITVFSLNPIQSASSHNVRAVYRGWRKANFEKWRVLKSADLLISGGGGLLQDTYPTKFLFGPLPYYLLITLLAKLCGTKVMFFAQGIGPVTTRWGKWLMKLANLADFITVRDALSKDYLIQLGVTRPEIVVTADIVFAFQTKPDDTCSNDLALDGDEQLVAVSVRPWFNRIEQFEKLAEVLDCLIERRQVTPVFVPMEGIHDMRAAEIVRSYMKHPHRTILLGTSYTPNQYLNFIGSCTLTIGMRLHALVFSTISGVPHIGFSYDKKVKSLLERNGMWPYSAELDDIDVSTVLSNALYLLDNRKEMSVTLLNIGSQMRDEALNNVRLMHKMFFIRS